MTEELIEFSATAETEEEERTITGLAIPYGVTTRDGRKHAFEAGAIAGIDEDVKLNFNHDPNAIIGSVFHSEDTPAGLKIKARISKSPRGEEIYTLIKEGHLNKFSVGVVGREFRQDDDVTVWTKADLHEVSVVPRPAFRNSSIEKVYSAQADYSTEKEIDDNIMNEDIKTEVVELKEQFSDLQRMVAGFGTPAPATTSKYNNGGEFLKALAAGDETAKNEIRFAYAGATSTDADVTRPGWVNRLIPVVDQGRPVLNLFAKAPLPATGNSIEYPVLASNSGAVAVQAAEGDDLAYLEVVVDTATAPVKTYGGYSEISRQAIERSDIAYLDTVLRFQAASYAKVTNTAVRTALTGATGVTTGTPLTVDSAQNWVNLVIDAGAAIDANGQGAQAAFVVMSPAVYKRVVGLVDTNARVQFDVNGDGSNTIGNANVLGRTGSLAGLPIVVDSGLTGNTVYVASQDAVTVFESAGAPFRLQDENIINLTKQFSLYGYMAIGVTNPGGIVKVVTTLA